MPWEGIWRGMSWLLAVRVSTVVKSRGFSMTTASGRNLTMSLTVKKAPRRRVAPRRRERRDFTGEK
jgi:hypothetical protein